MAAKFANRELNSFARSVMEVALIVLPLLDWVIVVKGVGKVVCDMLTVMVSLLTGDCPTEARQTACQSKKSRYLGLKIGFSDSSSGQMIPFGTSTSARFAWKSCLPD